MADNPPDRTGFRMRRHPVIAQDSRKAAADCLQTAAETPEDAVKRLFLAGQSTETNRALAQSVKHFEQVFGGSLPCTGSTIAVYITYCEKLHSARTITLRVALLGKWHREHGFADPTKERLVVGVLKGLRRTRLRQGKKARPITLTELTTTVSYLESQLLATQQALDSAPAPQTRRDYQDLNVLEGSRNRHLRDRALLLLGFWLAFRSDELEKLRLENCTVEGDRVKRLNVLLPTSKGDRMAAGKEWTVEEIPQLCPVNAFMDYIGCLPGGVGPVFVKLNRWGQPEGAGLRKTSINKLLRRILTDAGIDGAEEFSSHSLRRGFAVFADDVGGSLTDVKAWVQWESDEIARGYMTKQTSLPGKLWGLYQRQIGQAE